MPDTPELSEARRTLIEKYLRGDLPQTTMAAGIQRKPAPPSSKSSRTPITAIQSSGPKRPFFFVHVHWIGGAFYCFDLAHKLGSDQPFYMLEPYSFDGLQVPPTLETMVSAYIESLRTIQPEGPYILGGFCGGGLIIYEIAQQLRAAGQTVDLLALIDPWAGPIQLIKWVGTFIRRIGGLIHLRPDKQLDWFLRLRHLYRFVRNLQGDSTMRFPLFAATEALRQDWMGIFTWVVSDYVPRQYPGKVTYFWASENHGSRRMWWGNVAETENEDKEREVYIIPGKHMTLVTEHIDDLTEELGKCLSKVQTVALS